MYLMSNYLGWGGGTLNPKPHGSRGATFSASQVNPTATVLKGELIKTYGYNCGGGANNPKTLTQNPKPFFQGPLTHSPSITNEFIENSVYTLLA